jgi:hypothetical protein
MNSLMKSHVELPKNHIGCTSRVVGRVYQRTKVTRAGDEGKVTAVVDISQLDRYPGEFIDEHRLYPPA